jgi:hypothetical protein
MTKEKKAGNSAAKRKVEKGSTNSDGEDRLGSGGERHQIAGGTILSCSMGRAHGAGHRHLKSCVSWPHGLPAGGMRSCRNLGAGRRTPHCVAMAFNCAETDRSQNLPI